MYSIVPSSMLESVTSKTPKAHIFLPKHKFYQLKQIFNGLKHKFKPFTNICIMAPTPP